MAPDPHNTRIAAWTDDRELDQIIFPFIHSEIAEERYEAAMYLDRRGTPEARAIAADALAKESEAHIRELLEQVVGQEDR